MSRVPKTPAARDSASGAKLQAKQEEAAASWAPTRIIAIGGSAGAIEALGRIMPRLVAEMPPILVAVHIPPRATSLLPQILSRAGPLPAEHAADGQRLENGRVYVARPDHHLVVQDGVARLNRGPHENRSRPAIDPLFRSIAMSYGDRAIGVLLSGNLDDGTIGLLTIAEAGGTTIVQDPLDAGYPDMPRSAIENVAIEHVLPADAIAGVLRELVRTRDLAPTEPPPVPAPFDFDPSLQPTTLSCPDCGGVLSFKQVGDAVPVYRCQIGHQFSDLALESAQADRVEAALWSAVRLLEERADHGRRLADRLRDAGRPQSASRFIRNAADAVEHAAVIRSLLGESTVRSEPVDEAGSAEEDRREATAGA